MDRQCNAVPKVISKVNVQTVYFCALVLTHAISPSLSIALISRMMNDRLLNVSPTVNQALL